MQCLINETVAQAAAIRRGGPSKRVRESARARSTSVPLEESDCIFPSGSFKRLILEIVRGFIIDVHFTVEAAECIQALTEEYLVKLAEHANLNATQGRRAVITPHDLQLARQIRGER